MSDAVSRPFRLFSSSLLGLSEVGERRGNRKRGLLADKFNRTLCLIMINLAIQAGGPLSRTGLPVQKERPGGVCEKSAQIRGS